jgi:hypothetical protein
MEFKGSTTRLQTPFTLLSQNAAGLSSGSLSNGPQGGELRQQALERQQNSAMLQSNRVSEAYNHLESILETVVWRILAGPAKPGTDGYREIMWIRARLEAYQIDFKKLAERKFGRFQYIRVRARRSIGNGDRVQQIETADWLMNTLPNLPPESRPRVIRRAIELHTQDPDLAESLVKVPKTIINAQKITAENECDTIKRRAPLGQILPVSADDIHQDHIPIHLLDMQAMVASNKVRPWDKLDVLTFTGLVQHVGQHIEILMSNPATNAEGKAFVQDYQNITQAAQAIIAEVDQREQQQGVQAQMTPKEQADMQLKLMQEHRKGVELGLKTEALKKLEESRDAKHSLAERQQYVGELHDSKRLQLDEEKMKVQAANTKQEDNAPA